MDQLEDRQREVRIPVNQLLTIPGIDIEYNNNVLLLL